MKLGILQTGRAPEALMDQTGDYDALFRDLLANYGFEFVTYAVLDGEFPTSAEDADAWLITGSRHGVYEDHDWIPPLEDLIRKIDAQRVPLVGVCFGHQIIAQALGGKVEKFQGGWSIGATEYDSGGTPLVLNAWHQDQIVKRPDSAKVAASSDFCENAVLTYGDHIWTVQAHPEFTADFIDALIRTRGRGVVPDALLDAATDRLSTPTDDSLIAKEIAAFFKKPRP